MKNYNTDSEAIRMFKNFIQILRQPIAAIPVSLADGLILLVIGGMVCFGIGVVVAVGNHL